jgi:hypothetical protein
MNEPLIIEIETVTDALFHLEEIADRALDILDVKD